MVDLAEGRRLLADLDAGLTVQVPLLTWSRNNLPALLDEILALRAELAVERDRNDALATPCDHLDEVEALRAEVGALARVIAHVEAQRLDARAERDRLREAMQRIEASGAYPEAAIAQEALLDQTGEGT